MLFVNHRGSYLNNAHITSLKMETHPFFIELLKLKIASKQSSTVINKHRLAYIFTFKCALLSLISGKFICRLEMSACMNTNTICHVHRDHLNVQASLYPVNVQFVYHRLQTE